MKKAQAVKWRGKGSPALVPDELRAPLTFGSLRSASRQPLSLLFAMSLPALESENPKHPEHRLLSIAACLQQGHTYAVSLESMKMGVLTV